MLQKNVISHHSKLLTALCAALLLTAGGQSSFGATLTLDFNASVPGTIQDSGGNGTGFTTPLSGTNGTSPNSGFLLSGGALQVTGPSAGADFNAHQNTGAMQAPGINLASLGFTGSQDFSVSATFSVPSGAFSDFGQLGVYVGINSANLTRDGFVNVSSVNGGPNFYGATTIAGFDTAGTTIVPASGLTSSDILTATISRTGGVFSETVTDGSLTYNVTPTQPTFLNDPLLTDLTVGIYSTNTPGETAFTTSFDSFTATVVDVPEPGTWALMLGGLLSLVMIKRIRVRRA